MLASMILLRKKLRNLYRKARGQVISMKMESDLGGQFTKDAPANALSDTFGLNKIAFVISKLCMF